MSVQFERVALIGIGLIGSSLAHVMRREKIAAHITGYAKSEATRKAAVELGLVDSIHSTAALTEPTSVTMQPGFSAAPISCAMAPQAPTGTHRITRSASLTAEAAVG